MSYRHFTQFYISDSQWFGCSLALNFGNLKLFLINIIGYAGVSSIMLGYNVYVDELWLGKNIFIIAQLESHDFPIQITQLTW